MNRQHAALGLVVLLAVGLGVWLLGTSRAEAPGEGEAASRDGPVEAPTLETAGQEDAARGGTASEGAGGTLRVHVLENGVPVDAMAWVHPTQALRATSNRPPFDPSVAPGATRPAAGQATPDVGKGLSPGRYEIQVAIDARRRALVRVAVGDAAQLVRVEMTSGTYAHTGRAQYSDGTPFRGWLLHRPLLSADHGAWRPAWRGPVRCDEDGAFTFTAMSRGAHEVWAVDGKGFGSVRRRLTIPAKSTQPWIVDDALRVVTGTVRALAGRAPLAEVRVRATNGYAGQLEFVSETTTGPDGQYRLRVPEHFARAEFTKSGFAPRKENLTRGVTSLDVLLRAGAPLGGRIVPVGGATDGLAGVTVFAGALRTRTDAQGRVAFESAPDGSYDLFALGGGWCSRGLGVHLHGDYRPFHMSGARTGIELPVQRTGTFEGTVRWDTEAPVEGASCALSPGGFHLISHATRRVTTTDAAGRFVLRDAVPDLVYRLEVKDPATGVEASRQVVVRAAATTRQDLTLRTPTTVRLRVVADDTGAPVPNAQVLRSDDDPAAQTSPTGEAQVVLDDATSLEQPEQLVVRAADFADRPLELHGPHDGVLEVRLGRGQATSGRFVPPEGVPISSCERAIVLGNIWRHLDWDDDGNFAVPLAEGQHEIYVRCKWQGVEYAGSLVVEAGTRGNVIPLVKEPSQRGEAWVVHVRGPDGQAPTTVRAHHLSTTERGGHISYGLVFRDGTIRVHAHGTVPGWLDVFGARGADGTLWNVAPQAVGPLGPGGGERTITLEPGAKITGRVEDTDGTPMPGVRIRALSKSGPAHRWGQRDHFHAEAYSDAAGRFELVGLAHARYKLHVAGPREYLRSDDAEEVDAGTTDVRIRFARTPVFEVVVVDEEGAPIPGAQVRAYAGSGVTDHEGRAHLRGLAPDVMRWLRVYADGYRAYYVGDWMPKSETVTLQRGLKIRGRLLDGAHRPLAGRMVQLRGPKSPRTEAMTDPAGRFTFGNLAAGTFELKYFDVKEATAGEDIGDWVVDLAPQIHARIAGVEGTDAEAVLSDNGVAKAGSKYPLRRDVRDGEVRFARIHADRTYTLFVRDGPRFAWLRDVRPANDVLSVTLQRGGTIRGRLTGLTKRDRNFGVHVRVEAKGVRARAISDSAGNFAIEGMPAGTWKVEVPRSGWKNVRASIEATTDGPVVVLALPR